MHHDTVNHSPDSRAFPRGRMYLLHRLAAAVAVFQQLHIGRDVRIAGVLGRRLLEQFMGAGVVAAQHVGKALVVEDFHGRADDADGLGVSAVGEIEAAQPVVARGQPDPGLGIVRCFSAALRKRFSARPKLLLRRYFLPSCTSSLGSSPRRPGFDSGATGSPLGPGSAGWVTVEPVVSGAAAASGVAVAALPPSFGNDEQPARPVRAATRIKTRTLALLITRSAAGPTPLHEQG